MMWLNLLGMGLKTGAHLYSNRQKTKQAMSDAQLMHAQKMSSGQLEYSGKLLEARQSDWKDEFILLLLSIPIVMLGWSVWSDNPEHMEKNGIILFAFWKSTFLVSNNFRRSHCECLWT